MKRNKRAAIRAAAQRKPESLKIVTSKKTLSKSAQLTELKKLSREFIGRFRAFGDESW